MGDVEERVAADAERARDGSTSSGATQLQADAYDSGVSYYCVAGHVIGPKDLSAATEICLMDGGARVRICREHGTAIAGRIDPRADSSVALDL
jgi:hypothetical protein